jgi:hypothetical protein
VKLLTQALRAKLPPLGATDHLSHDDVRVQVKFFTPDSSWTFYAIEFDGEHVFFGLVVGFNIEAGYFSLSELEAVRGPLGLPIERDGSASPTTGLWFEPVPLSRLPEYGRWAGARRAVSRGVADGSGSGR